MQKNKGFTLTELLVTVGTIGVISSLLLPVVAKTKHRARDTQCMNNRRNLWMNMIGAYDSAVSDAHPTDADQQEFGRIFCEDNLKPFLPDSTFKNANAYFSKPLTCPYALKTGPVRAPFGLISASGFSKEFPSVSLGDVSYFSYTYYINENFLSSHDDNFPRVAIADTFNYSPRVDVRVGDILSYGGIDDSQSSSFNLDQNITFDSSVLHPHKGPGAWVTLGDGSSRWLKTDRLE
jgi:prepilin-type N-terminal cleavage/methylation domain-containing protein